jgi:glucose-6-phosphate 1-epimerase
MSIIEEQEVPPDLPHIQRIEVNQLQCLRVQTARAELLIAEQGAQVLRYQVTARSR